MSISNATETGIMKLIFQAVTFADYGTSTGSGTPETNISNALHTADPLDAGAMNTSEVTYTSYARVNVARTTGGWAETSGSVSPIANIDFPAGTGGSGSAGFWSTGHTGAAAQPILWSGTVNPAIATGNGVTPRLIPASTLTLD